MPRPQFSLKTMLWLVAGAGLGCWFATWLAWLTVERAFYVACVCSAGAASVLAVKGWKT